MITEAVRSALRGVDAAYYLVHSMEPGDDDFAARDRQMAETFVAAAEAEGVRRLVYLGGIEPDGQVSAHLQSRLEVEEVLGSGAPELVALRASMVVGSKSDSFRTLAQIVGRLPVLALPSWRDNRTQPIAVADVVEALMAARTVAPGSYEIAGPDEVTIAEMCRIIGDELGRVRPSFALPLSSAKLESAAAATIADSDRAVLEPLLEGMHDDLRIHDNELESVFGVTPTPIREATTDALAEMDGAADEMIGGSMGSSARKVAVGFAAFRIGYAVGLLAAPERVARAWVGAERGHPAVP